MNKDIKLKMSVLDENGKLVEIPDCIQKHIEAREKFWVDKIKAIDSKCEIILERLTLTEKALELACDKIADMLAENDGGAWFYDFDGCSVIERDGFEDFYKRYAKEMLKDENN